MAIAAIAVGWFFSAVGCTGWLPPFIGLLHARLAAFAAIGILICSRRTDLRAIPEPRAHFERRRAETIRALISGLHAWDIILRQVLPANPILGLARELLLLYSPLPYLWVLREFQLAQSIRGHSGADGGCGFGALAWLMLAIGRLGWNLRNRVPPGFPRGYVYACLGRIGGTLYAGMHGDWFIPFVYNIGFNGFRASVLAWMFMGGLVAVQRMTVSSSSASESQ